MFRHSLSVACLAATATAAAIDAAAVSQLLADIDTTNDDSRCCTLYADVDLQGASKQLCLPADESSKFFDLRTEFAD